MRPSATLPTTSHLGLRGGKPLTTCLSFGTGKKMRYCVCMGADTKVIERLTTTVTLGLVHIGHYLQEMQLKMNTKRMANDTLLFSRKIFMYVT